MSHITKRPELSKANLQKNKAFGKIFPHESCSKKIPSKIYSSHMKALLPIIRSQCQLHGSCSLSYAVLGSKTGLSVPQVKRTLALGREHKIIFAYYHHEMKKRKGRFVDILVPELLQDYHDYNASKGWWPKANKIALENPDIITSNFSKKKTTNGSLKECLPKHRSVPCIKNTNSQTKEFVRKEDKTNRILPKEVKKEKDPRIEFAKAFPESQEMQEKCWITYNECVLKHKLAKYNPIGYTIILVKKQEADNAIEFYDKKLSSKQNPTKEKQKTHYQHALNYLEPIEKLLESKSCVQILDFEDKKIFRYHDLHSNTYFDQTLDLRNPDSVRNGVRKFLNTGQLLTYDDKLYLKGVSKYVYL